MNLGSSKAKIVAPIKMDLSSQSKPKEPHSLIKKSAAVEQAFGEDSDDSEEEMPAEARMRMRNIGRETPTAAGPNSFGKGRLGFCDRQKIIERELVKKTDS
ncbi:PEST proteolytic signal-containing nuclear protein-like [Pomacea canaliculata]|uniref:PEST proteolytic signal-containing nuclear protein-like n=1 Tax=Pomacea canaliculata TaxID=400727 RepID=UPI000D73B04C|nr:PEST proteolytic signal-containing nuclear protein-like [Pomacea canaliculata]XP_025098513.1 PEST proteolytic signal-containing nuclear protein-like [Pomacea canaliculata]